MFACRVCVPYVYSALEGQRGRWIFLELELQTVWTVMWVLGTQLSTAEPFLQPSYCLNVLQLIVDEH